MERGLVELSFNYKTFSVIKLSLGRLVRALVDEVSTADWYFDHSVTKWLVRTEDA